MKHLKRVQSALRPPASLGPPLDFSLSNALGFCTMRAQDLYTPKLAVTFEIQRYDKGGLFEPGRHKTHRCTVSVASRFVGPRLVAYRAYWWQECDGLETHRTWMGTARSSAEKSP